MSTFLDEYTIAAKEFNIALPKIKTNEERLAYLKSFKDKWRKHFDPLVLIMLGDPDKNSERFKKLETLVSNFYSIDEMIKELEDKVSDATDIEELMKNGMVIFAELETMRLRGDRESLVMSFFSSHEATLYKLLNSLEKKSGKESSIYKRFYKCMREFEENKGVGW